MSREWVLINKLAEISGYSEKAIRRKIEEGVFIEGIHWRYSPDNRIHFNLEAYYKWVEQKPTTVSMRGKRRSPSASSGGENDSEKQSHCLQPQPM